MTWESRVGPASYTSPRGAQSEFAYEDLDRSGHNRTAEFNFPDLDGTYVQSNGHRGRRYPMRIIFHGEDHDLDAQAFVDALDTPGAGVLEHPVWGRLDVVPFGDWKEQSKLKTAANQTIFDVTFYSTIGLDFPESDVFTSDAILVSLTEYNQAAAAEFGERVDTRLAVQRVALSAEHDALREQVYLGLRVVASSQEDVRAQFDAINLSLEQSVRTFVADPTVLAAQTALFVQSPARAVAAQVTARTGAYVALGTVLTTAPAPADGNKFRLTKLFAQLAVTGYVLSVVNTQFETKVQALEAADGLLELMAVVVAWQDEQLVALDEIDTGSAYQQLQEAVALTAGFLVQLSFSLKQEHRVALVRARTLIDVCAEYLGAIDNATLDHFAEANDLSGSELLELSAGRDIVYYR